MRAETQLLSARSVRWLDAGVVVWIVVWVVLGVVIWHDIRAQAQLSTDVIKVGTAVKDTGQALGVVGGLPLVGGRIGEFADRIETMGAEVEASGEDSRAGIERIAVIAGFAVGVLPAALVLAALRAGARPLEAVRRGDRGRAAGSRGRPGAGAVSGAPRRRRPLVGRRCGRSAATRGATSPAGSTGRSPTPSSSGSDCAGPRGRRGSRRPAAAAGAGRPTAPSAGCSRAASAPRCR